MLAAPATEGGGGPLGGAVTPAIAGTEPDGEAISAMMVSRCSAMEGGVMSAEVADENV
jgi:hypothetical protein